MTFDNLTFHHTMTDKQALTFFPNGYGASVIQGPYTYGGPEGLYELAVLRGDKDGWRICYSSPITDGVLGHLSESEVTRALTQIEALPKAP